MSTYAIGDIQGCFEKLLELLELINFDVKKDTLWFTGDLVNRGPNSLETLRFIKSLSDKSNTTSQQLSSVISVLGNHDLTLLAVASGAIPYNSKYHTFSDILNADDSGALLTWLRKQPLVHYDQKLDYLLVHAGILPKWDLATVLVLAEEVENILHNDNNDNQILSLYENLYGNTPNTWNENLSGWDRIRFIINCFTRIRFCTPNGTLDFDAKETIDKAPGGFYPWFKTNNRTLKNQKIIFGHWAALEGIVDEPNVFVLDTGRVWGNCLTAMRLEDKKMFSINCH